MSLRNEYGGEVKPPKNLLQRLRLCGELMDTDYRFMGCMVNCEADRTGTATAWSGCGCSQTRLMTDRTVYIEWKRCEKHYEPSDDRMILIAAHNKRVLEAESNRKVTDAGPMEIRRFRQPKKRAKREAGK